MKKIIEQIYKIAGELDNMGLDHLSSQLDWSAGQLYSFALAADPVGTAIKLENMIFGGSPQEADIAKKGRQSAAHPGSARRAGSDWITGWF